uniref:Uncharacterized protein n=1 Tax=Zea mays TaxID=4577 RepID=C4J8D8_MAIZE|nr:unknown [Zea mays]
MFFQVSRSTSSRAVPAGSPRGPSPVEV